MSGKYKEEVYYENVGSSYCCGKKKIAISLGGRLAEREVFADISLGSSYDECYAYEKARLLATRHVAYGYDLVLSVLTKEELLAIIFA